MRLPRPPRPAPLLYAVGLTALLAVAGCAGQGSADDGSAAAAALRFTRDLADSPTEACGLLAPQTLKELEDSQGPCPSSLPGLGPAASGRRAQHGGLRQGRDRAARQGHPLPRQVRRGLARHRGRAAPRTATCPTTAPSREAEMRVLFVGLPDLHRSPGSPTASRSAWRTDEAGGCARPRPDPGVLGLLLAGPGRPGADRPGALQRGGGRRPGCPGWRWASTSRRRSFAVDVAENWQSEYLQFLLYILLTVWLVQQGSPESKPLDKAGRESDKEQKVGAFTPDRTRPAWARVGGWRLTLYSRSLGLTMGAIFLLSWTAPARRRAQRLQRRAAPGPPGPAGLGRVPLSAGLLEPHLAELAVRVPRRGQHGGAQHLPARARVTGVQTGGRAPHLHGRRGLRPAPELGRWAGSRQLQVDPVRAVGAGQVVRLRRDLRGRQTSSARTSASR